MAKIFGSFGLLPIKNATQTQKGYFFPVAEAEVALGKASSQLVSSKLEDLELALSFYGETAPAEAMRWINAGKSRKPEILTIGKRPEGEWLIVGVVEEIRRAIDDRILFVVLRVTFKEVGAFLWVGNYNQYEPPPTVRKTAEAGISGLSKAALGWLGVK
jgi:hypothetical protein